MKMIANREQCLEPAALNDLLLGRLPPERFDSALQHVESCELCTQAAEAASGGSAFSWVGKAVNSVDKPGFHHEPECQAAVGNLLLQPTSRIAGNSALGSLPTESLGPYRLLKWLGSGGMGSVYLAEHQRLKRMAAIKLLPREKLLQSGWLDRFNREMTSIAALEHPHVVRAIDAGDEGGWHFLVMEYLDGADLSKVCRRMGDIPVSTACELIRQAALGLGAIHSLGMTHRDIKPSNLFLTRNGTVKLLDLGLVLSGDSPLAADERLTTVGHLMGTVPYMAREQLVDASSVDWRADIYSLGATLFRLLTGRAPFGPAANLAQTIQAISTTPCPTLKSLKPDAPDEVAHLVARMLSHAPAQRPQSAQEIAELLTPFCDSDAPQSLIRAALNCPDDQDQQPTSQLHFSQLQPRAELDNSGKSKSRWPMWIAAAFVPFAFFAGILITVTTDKGTLVIESDEPGVSVTVTQGDKVVETLRVERQPSVLRLQSGKYIVELTGIESDGLEVSDSRVALTRGEKQIVRIQQRPSTSNVEAVRSDSNETQYQGKSLAYWMNLLDREKDIATIAQAMQAVELLAETEQARLAAARKCMFIARRLGGIIQSGRPSAQDTNQDASGWFMSELVNVYPKFLPEPALQVIIEELEHGTERSAQACFLFLSMFADTNGFPITPTSLKELYAHMAQSEPGRTQLRKLEKLLEAQIDRSNQALKTASVPNSYLLSGHRFIADGGVLRRAEVLNALGDDFSTHPQVVEWAKKTLANNAQANIDAKLTQLANANIGGMGGDGGKGGMSDVGFAGIGSMFGHSPLDPRSALVIQQALSKQEYNALPVILAYLGPAGNIDEVELTAAFASVAKEKPSSAAAAIVTHFELAQKPGFISIEYSGSEARVKLAKETLLAHSLDSIEVVKALGHALDAQDPRSIIKKEDIEDLLRQMAVRLTREASGHSDNEAETKDELAIHIFASFDIPEKQLNEGIDLLLARKREYFKEFPSKRPVLTNHIAERFSENQLDPQTYKMYVQICLLRLIAMHPQPFIETHAKQLKATGYIRSQEAFFGPLIQALKTNTPVERQLDSSQESLTEGEKLTKVAMLEFLKSEKSAATIQKLDEAYQVALERLVDANVDKANTEEITAEVSHLLYDRLTIARYLGKDVESKTIRNARIMAGWTDPVIELDQLLAFSSEHGFKSIHFSTIFSALESIQKSSKCDEIASLMKGLHDSRPEAFRNYFLEDLETGYEFGQLADLYGGLDASCDRWYYAILKPLIEHPETRDRARAAITKIIQRLPPDKQIFLEKLLQQ